MEKKQWKPGDDPVFNKSRGLIRAAYVKMGYPGFTDEFLEECKSIIDKVSIEEGRPLSTDEIARKAENMASWNAENVHPKERREDGDHSWKKHFQKELDGLIEYVADLEHRLKQQDERIKVLEGGAVNGVEGRSLRNDIRTKLEENEG